MRMDRKSFCRHLKDRLRWQQNHVFHPSQIWNHLPLPEFRSTFHRSILAGSILWSRAKSVQRLEKLLLNGAGLPE